MQEVRLGLHSQLEYVTFPFEKPAEEEDLFFELFKQTHLLLLIIGHQKEEAVFKARFALGAVHNGKLEIVLRYFCHFYSLLLARGQFS